MGRKRREFEGPDLRHVKLMADYGAFPLWANPVHGQQTVGGLSPTDLPLSPELIDELWQWAAGYDALLKTDYTWPSTDAKAAFVAEGRRLLNLVRAELGPDYEVIYFDEAGDRATT